MKKTLWIGSDHAGFELKSALKAELSAEYNIRDAGPFDMVSVDYPDYADKVGHEVAKDTNAQGVLICGSGIGVSIAANKVPGVRAALIYTVEAAKLAKQHNNANIICLGARMTTPALALELVKAWLGSTFEGGRHQNRIDKITKIEKKAS